MVAPLALLAPVLGDAVRGVLDRLFPDPAARAEAELRLRELERAGTFAERAELSLAQGQIGVNKVEAASAGVFRGGWRPAAGWVCVAGLAYDFLVRPVLPWCLTVAGVHDVPPLPPLDIESILALLAGLLGLGTLRHRERIKGHA